MTALCACAFGVKKLRTDCCLFELFSGFLLELMLMRLNCAGAKGLFARHRAAPQAPATGRAATLLA